MKKIICVKCNNEINPSAGFYNYPSGVQCPSCVNSKKRVQSRKEKSMSRKEKLARLRQAQSDIIVNIDKARNTKYKSVRSLILDQIEANAEISKTIIEML